MKKRNFWNNLKRTMILHPLMFTSDPVTWVGEWIDTAAFAVSYVTVSYLAEAETRRNEELSIKNEIQSQRIIITRLKEDLNSVQNISEEKEVKIKILERKLYKKNDEIEKLIETAKKLRRTKKEIRKKLKAIEEKLSELKKGSLDLDSKNLDKLNTLLAKVKNLVQEAKIQEAIKMVLKNIVSKTGEKYNELSLHLNRVNSNSEHYQKGLISYSEYKLIENNVIYSFLSMIDSLGNKELI